MPSHWRYYMSRVIKLGELNTRAVIEAIRNPSSVQIRGAGYTFTDCRIFGSETNPAGVFARLAKYRPEGAVDVVRPDLHAMAQEEVENLIEASSPFVYLPDYSGVAYRHVWNVLPRDQFERAFCELVESHRQKFFVRCQLEPVADLRTFVSRLARLDRLTVLEANVKPPNPLFGPCWKSLAEYLKKRRLEEVQVREQATTGIETRVQQIAAVISREGASVPELRKMMEPLLEGIGDAALLMAADGYGRAKVVGIEEKRTVTIRTSENQKSFLMSKTATPEEVFRTASEQFGRINDERQLEHP